MRDTTKRVARAAYLRGRIDALEDALAFSTHPETGAFCAREILRLGAEYEAVIATFPDGELRTFASVAAGSQS